ncbi:hypothetical protein [Nostoc sp. DSM 114167]|uniref:hypothetical protein n=1 Tax=Nostoc sp. DSM 114167 TaxID=3439050 RepID=UPI0040467998
MQLDEVNFSTTLTLLASLFSKMTIAIAPVGYFSTSYWHNLCLCTLFAIAREVEICSIFGQIIGKY